MTHDKANVVAMQEAKAFRAKRVAESRHVPTPRKLIETDAEQMEIRRRCAATLHDVNITDPRARFNTAPCAWLWSAA